MITGSLNVVPFGPKSMTLLVAVDEVANSGGLVTSLIVILVSFCNAPGGITVCAPRRELEEFDATATMPPLEPTVPFATIVLVVPGLLPLPGLLPPPPPPLLHPYSVIKAVDMKK
jgi:hypothetical protein